MAISPPKKDISERLIIIKIETACRNASIIFLPVSKTLFILTNKIFLFTAKIPITHYFSGIRVVRVVLQTVVHLGTMYLDGLVGLLSWSVKGVVAFEWAAAAIIIRAL